MNKVELGSLRALARREVARQMAANSDFRRNRDSLLLHLTRMCLGRTGLFSAVVTYGLLATAVAGAEMWNDAACARSTCSLLLPSGLVRTERLEDILREVGGFMLGVQTGLLGVLSIAVALVTLIGQRDHAEADVRVYYHESFAVPLAGSSLALLAVLLIQLFWPAELFSPDTASLTSNLSAEMVLTGVHLGWLVVNILLYSRFTLISLSFGQERQRVRFRTRYTANVSAPYDIFRAILRSRYFSAPAALPRFPSAGVSMGPHYLEPPSEGVVLTLRARSRLHDVWLGPLGYAIERWHGRASRAEASPALSFMVDFDSAFEGRVVLCRTHDGGEPTFIERQLIRACFRFKRSS